MPKKTHTHITAFKTNLILQFDENKYVKKCIDNIVTTQSKIVLNLDEHIIVNDKHLKSNLKKPKTMDYFNDNATTHLKKMDTTVDNLANTDLEVTNQSITDRLNNTLDIMKAESKSFLP